MEIQLEDLKPQDAELILGGKLYKFRRFTMDDEAWLRETFKNDDRIFTNQMTYEQLIRIAFHQLEDEFKPEFKRQPVTIINDEGDSLIVDMGGWKLFRKEVAGMPEKVELMKTIIQLAGISRPMLDKIMKEENKKVIPDAKKKRTGHR